MFLFLLKTDFQTLSHLFQGHKNQSLAKLKWSQSQASSPFLFFRCSIIFPFTPLWLTIKFCEYLFLIWLPLATYHLFIPDDDCYHHDYYHLQQISIEQPQGACHQRKTASLQHKAYMVQWMKPSSGDWKHKLCLWAYPWYIAKIVSNMKFLEVLVSTSLKCK